jgi:hypothetical protein
VDACLICFSYVPLHRHHWPRTRRYGSATVPLCPVCHTKAHAADPQTIQALIERAPDYWRAQGTWEANRADYERFLDRRRYYEQCRTGGIGS